MDVFFQMPSFVTILDFVGTFAFAISGIRLASAKRFDWFGAYVVGLATAIGLSLIHISEPTRRS